MRVGDRVSCQGQVGTVVAADLTPGMLDIQLESGLTIRKSRRECARVRESARPNPVRPPRARRNPRVWDPESRTYREVADVQLIEPEAAEDRQVARVEEKQVPASAYIETLRAHAQVLESREKRAIERDLSKKKAWSGTKWGAKFATDKGFFTREDPPRLTPRGEAVAGNAIDATAYYLAIPTDSVLPFSHWLTQEDVERRGGLEAAVKFFEGEGLELTRPLVRSYVRDIRIKHETKASKVSPEAAMEKRRAGVMPPPNAVQADGKFFLFYPKKTSAGQEVMSHMFSPYMERVTLVAETMRDRGATGGIPIESVLRKAFGMTPDVAQMYLVGSGVWAGERSVEFEVEPGSLMPVGIPVRVGFRAKAKNPYFSWVPSQENVDLQEVHAPDPSDLEAGAALNDTAKILAQYRNVFKLFRRLSDKETRDENVRLEDLGRIVSILPEAMAKFSNWLSRGFKEGANGQVVQIMERLDVTKHLVPVPASALALGLIQSPTGRRYEPTPINNAQDLRRVLDRARKILTSERSPWKSVFEFLYGNSAINPLQSFLKLMLREGWITEEQGIMFESVWTGKTEVGEAIEPLARGLKQGGHLVDDVGLWRLRNVDARLFSNLDAWIPDEHPNSHDVLFQINVTLDILRRRLSTLQVEMSVSRDQRDMAQAFRAQVQAEKAFAADILTVLALYTQLGGTQMLGLLSSPQSKLDAEIEKLRIMRDLRVRGGQSTLQSQANVVLYKTYNPVLFQATRIFWSSGHSLLTQAPLLQAVDQAGAYGTIAAELQRAAMFSESQEDALEIFSDAAASGLELATKVQEDGRRNAKARVIRDRGDKFRLFTAAWPLGKGPGAAAALLSLLSQSPEDGMALLRHDLNQALRKVPASAQLNRLGLVGVQNQMKGAARGKKVVRPGVGETAQQLKAFLARVENFNPRSPAEELAALVRFKTRHGLAPTPVYDAETVQLLMKSEQRVEAAAPLAPFEKMVKGGRPFTARSSAGHLSYIQTDALPAIDAAIRELKAMGSRTDK